MSSRLEDGSVSSLSFVEDTISEHTMRSSFLQAENSFSCILRNLEPCFTTSLMILSFSSLKIEIAFVISERGFRNQSFVYSVIPSFSIQPEYSS